MAYPLGIQRATSVHRALHREQGPQVRFVRFASLACSDGSSIISEVFNVPSETIMIEVFGPLMAAFLLLMAAFGIRRLLHQFRNRMTPEQRQAARDSFRRRLVHPNPSEVEQEMGALLPQRLLTLYSDHQTILAARTATACAPPNGLKRFSRSISKAKNTRLISRNMDGGKASVSQPTAPGISTGYQ